MSFPSLKDQQPPLIWRVYLEKQIMQFFIMLSCFYCVFVLVGSFLTKSKKKKLQFDWDELKCTMKKYIFLSIVKKWVICFCKWNLHIYIYIHNIGYYIYTVHIGNSHLATSCCLMLFCLMYLCIQTYVNKSLKVKNELNFRMKVKVWVVRLYKHTLVCKCWLHLQASGISVSWDDLGITLQPVWTFAQFYSPSGRPRCRWVCFFIRTDLEKCSIASPAHRCILCSDCRLVDNEQTLRQPRSYLYKITRWSW